MGILINRKTDRLSVSTLPCAEFVSTAAVIAGGAILGAGSIAGKAIAGSKAARAAESAAQARISGAREVIDLQTQERRRIEKVAQEAAAPSVRELESINRLVDQNTRNLDTAFSALNQELRTLEETTDPAIKAAGENITALLRGEAAKALAPVRRERQRQKTELEGQLRARLGSGFRTSTAGIQALQNFNDQTQLLVSETQNRALQTATQTFGTIAGARRAGVSGAAQLAGVGAQVRGTEVQAEQVIAGRRARAATAGLQQPISFGGILETAGEQFQGDVIRAETFSQAAGTIGQLGGVALGAGAAGAAGATTGQALRFGQAVAGATGGGGRRQGFSVGR